MKALTLYRSGWCGTEQHGLCPGSYAGCGCSCECHLLSDPAVATAEAPSLPAVSGLSAGERGSNPEHDDHDQLQADLDSAADHDLGWALAMLTQAITVLGEVLLDWDGADVEACELLGIVRAQRIILARSESLIETHAAQTMAADVVEWPGGRAERRWGKDRREWDHEGLIRAVAGKVAESLAVDPATGELDEFAATLAHNAIGRYAATNRPQWRTTAVKPLGLDPDEWCSASPARATVTVVLGDAS